MSKEHLQYLQEINERINVYNKGLAQVQHLIKDGQYSLAAEQGFKTILKSCNQTFPEINDLFRLREYCISVMQELPVFIPESISLKEMVKRLEGILIERHAFYTQLKNSSNWVSL